MRVIVLSKSWNEFKIYILGLEIPKEEMMEIWGRMVDSGRERKWYERGRERLSNRNLDTNRKLGVIGSSYNVDILDLYRIFWVISETDL